MVSQIGKSMKKGLGIAKWIIFVIVWGYSAMNVMLFVLALLFGCVDWNNEKMVAEMIQMAVYILICILWHIDLNVSTAYEKDNEFLKHDNESLQNAVVRKQNRIDELANVFWIIANKKVSMFYVSLSKDYERYNEYIVKEENKLTKKEFDEVKNYYFYFNEEESEE